MPRGNTAVIGALREALKAAESGQLVGFYGILEYRGEQDAECVTAGAYRTPEALEHLDALREWIAGG